MADPNLQGALVAASILEKLQEKVPDLAPLFAAVPELRALFIKILPPPAGENWTTDKFANELHKTDWWKNTPESARLWIAQGVSDPASASLTRQKTTTQYYQLAAQLGVSIPLPAMYLLVEAGLREGWDENKIRSAIMDQAHFKDPLSGQLDSTASSLRATAAQWGVPYGKQAAFNYAKKIVAGTGTQEGFEEQLRQHAKSIFPAWSDQIDNGMSVADLAEPYKQLAAQTLEMPEGQFNLLDNRWRKLLQQKNDKGQWTPMTLADAQTQLMTDPGYGYDHTRGARQAAVEMVDSLGQAFGRRP